MKHERYLNMQALISDWKKQVMLWGEKYVETSKPEKKLMFMFEFFLPHNIFMEDKTYGRFHYFSTQCCA